MPTSLRNVVPRHAASSPDLSFYELAPSGPDYLDKVSSLIARHVPGYGSVAEIGSTPGELCHALRCLAVSPEARADTVSYDLVLTREEDVGTSYDPRARLARCIAVARRAVVWVMPGDDGTRNIGPTLTGCLPRAWVAELERQPLSVELLCTTLSRDRPPSIITSIAWTVPLIVHDLSAFMASLVARLEWSGTQRERDLRHFLAETATVHPFGYAIPVSRRSAVIAWTLS
jgi:hypothetical protein